MASQFWWIHDVEYIRTQYLHHVLVSCGGAPYQVLKLRHAGLRASFCIQIYIQSSNAHLEVRIVKVSQLFFPFFSFDEEHIAGQMVCSHYLACSVLTLFLRMLC